MRLHLSALESLLMLTVPAFIGLQLFERLYFFRQLISPALLPLVPVLFFAIWLIRFTRENGVKIPSQFTLFFLSFCGYILVCIATQKLFIIDKYDLSGRSSLDFSTLTGTYAVTWGLIGLSVSKACLRRNDLAAFSIMAGIGILMAPNISAGHVDLIALRESTGIENLSHLWISENIVFLFCLCYGLARSYWTKLSILALTTLLLIAMVGRSSLFFTLAAVSVFEILFGDFRGVGRKLLIGGGLALLGLGVLLSVQELYNEEIFDKLLFKGGLDADASYEGRSQYFSSGLLYLKDQLLIGDPTILATKMGSVGAYIHNILSFWQFFGFFAFLILIVVVCIAISRMLHVMRISSHRPIFNAGALLLIYSVFSVLTSKHGAFWCLWFSVGLWSGTKRVHPTGQIAS